MDVSTLVFHPQLLAHRLSNRKSQELQQNHQGGPHSFPTAEIAPSSKGVFDHFQLRTGYGSVVQTRPSGSALRSPPGPAEAGILLPIQRLPELTELSQIIPGSFMLPGHNQGFSLFQTVARSGDQFVRNTGISGDHGLLNQRSELLRLFSGRSLSQAGR